MVLNWRSDHLTIECALAGSSFTRQGGSKMKKLKLVISVACLVIAGFSSNAMAISIAPTSDGGTLVSTMLGPGITIVPGSVSYTGATGASGTFTGGLASGIGIESGIIMTSGSAANAIGPNDNGGVPEISGGGGAGDDTTTNNGLPGDADLTALAGYPTADATILEFDFEPTLTTDLFFNYIFASEEYIDYENTAFNDIFAFYLDGANLALIPGTSEAVSINNVNSVDNSAFFNQNINPPFFDIEYDGFTNVFSFAALDLVPPGVHHFKMAIADSSDSILDSAVFIQGNSFSGLPTPISQVPEPTTLLLLCSGTVGLIALRRKL